MSNKVNCLNSSTIEGISRIIGDTKSGISGTEMARFLLESNIEDIDKLNSKWKRLYHALVNNQNLTQCSNQILNFTKKVMAPSRYLNDYEDFCNKRTDLNKVLSFEGYLITEKGGLSKITQANTIPEARSRAENLKSKLEFRNAHPCIFFYCKEELLTENYFHSVLEASKSVFDRLREISYIDEDGSRLIEDVLGGESPILIINNYLIESEKSEQRGFANLLKGLFGMFRNPLAHESKIKWEMNEEDALDILTLISYCHRRLDSTQKIR